MKKLGFMNSALHTVAALLVAGLGLAAVASCDTTTPEEPEEVTGTLTPSVTELTFTVGQTQTVDFTVENISEISVSDAPEGWNAEVEELTLSITAPSELTENTPLTGTVTVTGLVTDGTEVEATISVEVLVPAITMTENEGKLTVSYTGNLYAYTVYYGVMPSADYSPAAALAALEDAAALTLEDAAENVELATLYGSEFESGVSYTVWAVAKLNSSVDAPAAEDVCTILYNLPVNVSITVTETALEAMQIAVTVDGAASYLGGYFMVEETSSLEYLIEQVHSWGPNDAGYTYNENYSGSLGAFGTGWDSSLSPSTEYLIYVLPILTGKDGEAYTEDDIIYITASTSALQAGGSYNVAISEVTADKTTIQATLTAEGAYKVYASFISNEDLAAFESDDALANYLTNSEVWGGWFYLGNLIPGTEGAIVAIAIDEEGKYGTIAKYEIATQANVWHETASLSLSEPVVTVNSASIKYTVTGAEVAKIKYIYSAASNFAEGSTYYMYNGWRNDVSVMEEIVAGNDYYPVTVLGADEWSPLPEDNTITFEYLQAGMEYLFFIVAEAADGTYVHGATCSFTPGISSSDLIRIGAEGYDFGKPTVKFVSGMSGYGSSYDLTFNVTMDSTTCAEYYLTNVDPEYGSDWLSKFYYVFTNGYAQTESGEQTLYYVNAEQEIGLVWKDVNGKYHETELSPASTYIDQVPAEDTSDDTTIDER